MEVMFMLWISSGKMSSVMSSMMASIDRFIGSTAVSSIFFTPNATSTSLQFSLHLRPSGCTFSLICLNSSLRSCSASQGLISRLHNDLCVNQPVSRVH